MAAAMIDDLRSSLKRRISRNHRRLAVDFLADCRAVNDALREVRGETSVEERDGLDRTFHAAKAAIEALCMDPPCSYDYVVEQFNYAQELLAHWKHKLKITERSGHCIAAVESQLDRSRRDGENTAKAFAPDLCPSNDPISGGETDLGRQSEIIKSSKQRLGSTNISERPEDSSTRLATPIALQMVANPSRDGALKFRVVICDGGMDTAGKLVDLDVECSDSSFDALIFLITRPDRPGSEEQLTPLRDHTRFYTREKGRHGYTKGGLEVKRLVPEQPLKGIPPRADGTRTVYVMQGEEKYIIVVVGHSPGTDDPPVRDRAITLYGYHKKYLREPLLSPGCHETCRYTHKTLYTRHEVNRQDDRTWSLLPGDQVAEYSADWIAALAVPLTGS